MQHLAALIAANSYQGWHSEDLYRQRGYEDTPVMIIKDEALLQHVIILEDQRNGC